jgi:hypothetical protein
MNREHNAKIPQDRITNKEKGGKKQNLFKDDKYNR